MLCGVDDQPRALRELRRVLRPDGQLLFIEHVRSGDPGQARLQDRMNWLNRLVVCCDCNRPTLDSIREAGFTPANQAHHVAEGPEVRQPSDHGRRHPRRRAGRLPRSPQETVLTDAAVMAGVTVFRQLSRLKGASHPSKEDIMPMPTE